MLWRDFFYFSKGERRGLILLLSLVVIAVTLLYLNKQPAVQNVDEKRKTETVNLKDTTESKAPLTEVEKKIGQPLVESAKTAVPGATAKTSSSSRNTKETVSERVNRLTSRPQPTFTRAEKFAEGTIVELNTADTTTLKKVPGIGSAFANRIVNYRKVLGGYHSVAQLGEVYGIDEERFIALQPWFSVDPSHIKKIEINAISQDSLQRHPYISYAQARVIMQQRRQKGRLTGWENLQLLKEFSEEDISKLKPYISW